MGTSGGHGGGARGAQGEDRARPARVSVRPWVTGLTIALLCAIWGSTWLVIRGGLASLPPFTSAAARFALAGAVLAAVGPWLARREGGGRPSLRLVVTMGCLNVGASYSIVYWSETVLPSGLVSLLWTAFPLMMGVLGHVYLPDERLARRQWLGILTGLGGMALLFATDLRDLGPAAVPAGLVLLLSPAVSAVGNLIVKREGRGTSSVLLNRDGMLLGCALIGVLALVFERDAEARWTPAAIGSVAYLALAGSVLAFGLYFWLLRYAPTWQLAMISYIVPVIALSLGAALGDEPVGVNTVAGAALVLLGVGLVLGGRRRAAPTPARPVTGRAAG